MDNKEQELPISPEDPEDNETLITGITYSDDPLITGGPSMNIPDRNDDEPENTPPDEDKE